MIKFDSVTKQFPNGTIAFERLSFEVEKGGIKTITGPSGSGKTTIMRLLIKEYEPTEGKIWWQDKPLSKIKQRKIAQHRQKIGVVFQDYKLIEDLNVWENIALPLDIKNSKQNKIENRVTDLLKLVGLTDKALMFPCQLSGGEAQRVSIARALATGPKIIFADEPTGNLDAESSLHIIDLLKKINKLGTTLLLASHDQLVLEQLKDVPRITLSRHPSHQQDTKPNIDKLKIDKKKDKSKQKTSQDKSQEQAPFKHKKNESEEDNKQDRKKTWNFKGLGKFFANQNQPKQDSEQTSKSQKVKVKTDKSKKSDNQDKTDN